MDGILHLKSSRSVQAVVETRPVAGKVTCVTPTSYVPPVRTPAVSGRLPPPMDS